VVEYFKRSTHYTAQIRKVLQDHVDNYKEQEPDDAPKKVIWLYGLTQSCLDKKGQHAVSSVDEIDTRYHWVDIEKLSNDKNAYWLELVEKYGWAVDEMHGK
jgi:hypothetical protein